MRKYVFFFLILFSYFVLYKFCEKDFWIFISSVATFLLWLVAFLEFDGVGKVTKAKFVRGFNREFFTKETRELIMLFEYKALKFIDIHEIEYFNKKERISSEKFSYFLINEEIVDQFRIDAESVDRIRRKKYISTYEIDDFLGYFEDIGSFEKQGLLEIIDVYDHFSYYIETIWNDSEIQKYIKTLEGDIYENFEYIYNKCVFYGKKKRIKGNTLF